MKLKTFARRAAAAGAVLAALTLAALPALAAPKVQVSTTNAVADHADILSDETEQYVNDVSIKLSDACGAQIGVYTLDELLGNTTMEGFAYDVFNAWGWAQTTWTTACCCCWPPTRPTAATTTSCAATGWKASCRSARWGRCWTSTWNPIGSTVITTPAPKDRAGAGQPAVQHLRRNAEQQLYRYQRPR